MATIRLVVAEEGSFFRQAGRELTPQGMFVPTTHLLPIGQEVTVQLEDPAALQLFAAKGKVVGSRAAQAATKEPAGILVKFFALAPGSREWVESRRALYVEEEGISLDDLAPSADDTKPSPPAVEAPSPAAPAVVAADVAPLSALAASIDEEVATSSEPAGWSR